MKPEDITLAIEQISSIVQNIEQDTNKVREKLTVKDSQGASIELNQLISLLTTTEKQVNTTILPLQQWLGKAKQSPDTQGKSEQSIITEQLILGQQTIAAVQKLRESINELAKQVKQIQTDEQQLAKLI